MYLCIGKSAICVFVVECNIAFYIFTVDAQNFLIFILGRYRPLAMTNEERRRTVERSGEKCKSLLATFPKVKLSGYRRLDIGRTIVTTSTGLET